MLKKERAWQVAAENNFLDMLFRAGIVLLLLISLSKGIIRDLFVAMA